jgi:hypothetical protein
VIALGHFVEQFFVGCHALLQSAEVLEVTLAVLDRRWRIGGTGLLVAGDGDFRAQSRKPIQCRDPIAPAAVGS